MKTIAIFLYTLLSLLVSAHAALSQSGRFTVTPLEVTAVTASGTFTLKTAIHLDTETGQSYFLNPLTTNAATWTPMLFLPAHTNEPPTASQLRLTTNVSASKLSLLEVAPGKRAIIFEAATNTPASR